MQDKIAKARATVESCEKRMEGYRVELLERTNLEARENSSALKLKTWCKMVKSEILSPKTQEQADMSMPRSNNHTSTPIEKVKTLANTLEISDFPDVGVVLNSIKVFAWCLHLLEVVMRKPTVEEVRSLLALCDGNSLKIPESKCIRMLRSMSSRAQLWQSKAKKALAADNKALKPYDLILLRELLLAAKQIPLTMPEEARLWNTIEDKGSRHCICGGPSDGSFMLCCDSCDNWYHGSCMKLDQVASDALTKWICPPCSGNSSVKSVHINGVKSSDKTIPVVGLNPLIPSISQHAPNPVSLWPPFGLRSSPSATDALGKVGDSDNEDFDFTRKSSAKSTVHVKKELKNAVAVAPKTHVLPSQQAVKSSAPKSMSIPAQLASKNLPIGQGRLNNLAALSSHEVPATSSNLLKSFTKAAIPTTINHSLAAMKPPAAASSALESTMKTPIQSASLKSTVGQTIPSNKQTLSTHAIHAVPVKTTTVVKSVAKMPQTTATFVSAKTVLKSSVPSKTFVVPRDTVRSAVPNIHQSLIPIATSAAGTKVPVKSLVKYPKPENGASQAETNTNNSNG